MLSEHFARLLVGHSRRAQIYPLALALILCSFLAAAAPPDASGWTATWTQKADPPPGGRGWADLTFDTNNGRAVLFGGSASWGMDDVWQYDSATDRWMQLESSPGCPTDFAPPTGRAEHALEYDSFNQLYWIFGGSGYGCNGPARMAAPGTNANAVVDPTLTATTRDFYKDWTVNINDAIVYVSGYDPTSKKLTLASPLAIAAPGSRYYLYPQRGGGTFSYSPATRTWSSLTGPHWGYNGPQPINRMSPAMAYSTRDTAIVMFGGQGWNDTWVLDAKTKSWVQMLPYGAAGSPPGLAQLTSSMVYDSDNDVFVLFGGCLCTGDGGPSSGDTWTYQVSTNSWARMTPAVSPPARQGHNLVYDSANKAVVLFGGFDAATGTYYNDLWVYRYAINAWTQVFPSISPPGRRVGAMVYDPVRRLTVLYAGKNPASLHDVWTLQLQGSVADSPSVTTTSISPNAATAGGQAFTLTVTGANFGPSSVVRWNGLRRPTTYVRSTQLQARIPATDIASVGTAQVSVVTPGTSSSLPFTVTAPAPVPTLTSLSPATAAAGSAGFTLTATGSNFTSASLVRVNGSARATTFLSTTKLTATILAGDVTAAGTSSITVLTPAPGGGTSAVQTLTVARPALTVSTSNVLPGGPVTATLTNGAGGSTDWLGLAAVGTTDVGSYLQRTYVGAGTTNRTWVVDMPVAPGKYEFRFLPNNGSVPTATSPAVTVVAPNPTPSITSLSPSSVTAGATAFLVSVTGTGFVSGATASINGQARTVTFTSTTQLTVAVQASDVTSQGLVSVQVINPAPCAGSDCASKGVALTVTAPAPAPILTSISPSTVSAGGATFTLTVIGSNFMAGSVVNVNGANRTTTFGSATQLAATILGSDIAANGTLSITVITPAPGGGTSVPKALTVSAAPQAAPPQIPVGSWATIPNTAPITALPPEVTVTGELGLPRGLVAYSGGDLYQINGVWGFLLWGGGDGDGFDISLYFVPFDSSGPRALGGPYLAPAGHNYAEGYPRDYLTVPSRNQSNVVASDGKYAPKARHTYNSILSTMVNGVPNVFVVHGGLTQQGSTFPGGGTAACRLFNLTQTYAQAMARPDMGWRLCAPAPSSTVSSASAFDAKTGRVFVRSRNFVGTYAPSTDTWDVWPMPGAWPGGSDYAAGIAIDVEGRKVYVLGDRLAEVYDLDAKTWTDLHGKPWAAMTGNAIGWHARTRQIVSWWGGQNLLLINPATDAVRSVTMGGATVTPMEGSGTFGRFRVVPGTDQVVLLNASNQNVFIGSVPFDGSQVAPSLTPSSAAPTAPPVNQLPTAYLDGLDASGVVKGWAADSDRPTQPLQVAVVVDGVGVATIAADQPRPDVTAAFPQFTGNHGVVYTLPVTFRDGLAHQLRLFAIDDDGSRVEFGGSNVSFTLAAPGAPASTPTPAPAPNPTPTPTSSPGTISALPGQPLPVGQWVERPNAAEGQAYMAGRGGKHGRAFYHAGLKSMVFAGGDWHTSQPQYDSLHYSDADGSEIWSLDSLNDKWTLQRPFCVPGQPQPGAPDNVGWAYDSLRNRGLMSPGFYAVTQGFTDPCGSIYGWGGYAFDFTTKKYSGPDALAGLPQPPTGWGGDTGSSFSTYNSVLDEYVRVYGTQLQRLSLATGTWRVQALSNGNPNWNPIANHAQLVIDVRDQYLYWIDSQGRNIIKISLKDAHLTQIPLPAQYVAPPSDHDVYLAFDPVNRVLMVPNNVDMGQSTLNGLGILHVDTGAWEWATVPTAVTGSVWGFDEANGALIGIGKRVYPSAYYLYKYR